MDYGYYLSLLIQCQQQQDPNIQHEWLLDTRADAVRLANYLRNAGYSANIRKYDVSGIVKSHYVGVPFQTLKIS
jgi:hypothetical protein